MKKIFILILLISLLFISGCTNYGKKFLKKEIFEIEVVLTKEEVYDDVIKAINNYNDTSKKTINFYTSTHDYLISLNGVYKEDKSEENIKIAVKAEGNLAVVFSAKVEIYVKDGYIYTLSKSESNKEEIKKTKEVYTEDSNLGIAIITISEENILKDEYQFGEDNKGRIIIQDINGYFRMVIEDNEIIFIGYEKTKGELLYFDIEYDVADIKYPDFSDYVEE